MKLYTYMPGVGGRDEKNAMALKEINSNEEPFLGGRQLLMLLSNETTPLQSTNYQLPTISDFSDIKAH